MKKHKTIINIIKRYDFALLLVILLLGLFARLYKINSPVADWHSWRQVDTASVSKEYSSDGINLLYPKYHDISTIQTGVFNPEGHRFVEFPLYNAIHAWFSGIYPTIPFDVWGRMVSVLLSTISLYFVYLLGKRFLGVVGGLTSASVFAFMPFNIYFSRTILPEPLTVLFALTSLWMFVKFIDKDETVYLYISSLLFSLALLIKPYIFFYGVPMLYLSVIKFGLKDLFKQKRFFVALFLVAVPVLFWRWWAAQYPEGIPFWKWAFNGNGIRFRPAFWYWIFGERIGKLLLGVWGVVPLSFAVIGYEKKKAFIHSLIAGAIIYVSVVASANVMHDYYQTLIVPVVSIALASGIVKMWTSREFNLVVKRTLLIFCLALMFVIGANQAKEYYKINHPEIIQAGMAIEKVTQEDDLVIAPYNGDTAFLYQTGRWGWPFKDREIEELVEKGADYYVSVNYDDQTRDVMSKYEVVEENDSYVIVKLSN